MVPLTNKDTDDLDEPGVAYQKRSKWRLIFLVVLVILVALCVIFIALYAVEKSAREKAENEADKAREEVKKEKICSSKNCLFSAYGKQRKIKQYSMPRLHSEYKT